MYHKTVRDTDVKPSLFKNGKIELKRGIVPQSCLMSNGGRIITRLPDLDLGLFCTPCSLPSSDKEDEDDVGGEKVDPSQMAGR